MQNNPDSVETFSGSETQSLQPASSLLESRISSVEIFINSQGLLIITEYLLQSSMGRQALIFEGNEDVNNNKSQQVSNSILSTTFKLI